MINRFIKAEQLDDSDSVIKEKIKPLEEKKAVALGKVQKIEGELGVYETQLAEERERNLEEERQSLIERINERIDAVIQEYDGAERRLRIPGRLSSWLNRVSRTTRRKSLKPLRS